MAGWWLFLRARDGLPAIGLILGTTVLVLAAGYTVYELQVVGSQPARAITVWEAAPTALGAILPALLVPQMWTWERRGRLGRVRAFALGTASLALAVPAAVTVLARVRLPDDAPWAGIALNVVVISALAMTATALLGRVLGPLCGLGCFLLGITVQQAVPSAARWIPLTLRDRDLAAHAWVALAFAVVALAVWTLTLGHSRLADRLTAE